MAGGDKDPNRKRFWNTIMGRGDKDSKKSKTHSSDSARRSSHGHYPQRSSNSRSGSGGSSRDRSSSNRPSTRHGRGEASGTSAIPPQSSGNNHRQNDSHRNASTANKGGHPHASISQPSTSTVPPCRICGRFLANKRSLDRHMALHNSTRHFFECPHCRSRFPQQQSLQDHINRMHTTRIYYCPTCGKRFSHRSHMEEHRTSVHGWHRH